MDGTDQLGTRQQANTQPAKPTREQPGPWVTHLRRKKPIEVGQMGTEVDTPTAG